MRLLLVNPPPFQIVEPYYDTPPYPRTGLAHLAGYVREKTTHDVAVLDCKYEQLGYTEALERIEKFKPDVVGFGAFTNEIKPAAKLAELLKRSNNSSITVVGGVHVTALPEATLREFPSFDFGVLGEGELTLAELLDFLTQGGSEKLPAGVSRIDSDGQYCHGGSRSLIYEQDELPLPAWDLFEPAEEYILHTSRGCPYNCNFCMNPNGRKVRARSPENVIQELNNIHAFAKPKTIMFGDEIFTLQQPRVTQLLNQMISEGFHKKFRWWCQTHVSCIDVALATLMKQANCFRVGLGIETGDEQALSKMGKGTNQKKIKKAIDVLREAKLRFDTFFIMGQPNETEESIQQTINLAVDLNPDRPIFGVMVPYPGTKVAEMAKNQEAGYVLRSHDWNDYNKQLGNAMELQGLSRARIETLQLKGYLTVFFKNYRFIDLAKFIWTYRSEGTALVQKIIFGAIPRSRRKKDPAVSKAAITRVIQIDVGEHH